MIMTSTVSCPVSAVTVNENRVRITAGFIFLASFSYLLAPGWVIPPLLVADFFLRASGRGKFSPLNIVSGWLVRLMKIGNIPIDQAPKRFAAGLGLALAGALLIADICRLSTTAFVITIVFALFSFLESALGFCAGCHIYSLMKRLFYAGRGA
jgi:hypothetical protein